MTNDETDYDYIDDIKRKLIVNVQYSRRYENENRINTKIKGSLKVHLSYLNPERQIDESVRD